MRPDKFLNSDTPIPLFTSVVIAPPFDLSVKQRTGTLEEQESQVLPASEAARSLQVMRALGLRGTYVK